MPFQLSNEIHSRSASSSILLHDHGGRGRSERFYSEIETTIPDRADHATADDAPRLESQSRDAVNTEPGSRPADGDDLFEVDHFDFVKDPAPNAPVSEREMTGDTESGSVSVDVTASSDGGRPDPGPDPDATTPTDLDPDPAPPPDEQPEVPEVSLDDGRPSETEPGVPQVTPPSPPPGEDNAEFGRDPGATPDVPDPGTVTTYTSGGPASTSFNVTIDFIGTWSAELQASFIEAADYLSTIILSDVPDAIVNGVAIDDITITATLEGIDGVGGTLGSAGPREIRGDGTYLPSEGAMTFDSADAGNQLGLGNWDTIVLHEMLHALGFGTLWSLMGLTSGSVAGGDIRFIGPNATDVYQTEFPVIAGSDSGSLNGVPVETDGGPGTAGGHWDEGLFDTEIMTGFIDSGSFFSIMTIAALEDMGYDTVFDDAYDPNDLSGPIPVDPLLDLFV